MRPFTISEARTRRGAKPQLLQAPQDGDPQAAREHDQEPVSVLAEPALDLQHPPVAFSSADAMRATPAVFFC